MGHAFENTPTSLCTAQQQSPPTVTSSFFCAATVSVISSRLSIAHLIIAHLRSAPGQVMFNQSQQEEHVGKRELEGASNKAKRVELVKNQGLTRTMSLDHNQMEQDHELTRTMTIPTGMDPIDVPVSRTMSLPNSTLKGVCVVCDGAVFSTHQRTKSSLGYCHYDCTQKVIRGDAPISPTASANWFMGHPPQFGKLSPATPNVPLNDKAVMAARNATKSPKSPLLLSVQENEESTRTVSFSLEPDLKAKGAQQRSFEAGFRTGLQIPVDEKNKPSRKTRELNQMVGTMWEHAQHAAEELQLEHTPEELAHYQDPDEIEGMIESLWSQTFVQDFLCEQGSQMVQQMHTQNKQMVAHSQQRLLQQSTAMQAANHLRTNETIFYNEALSAGSA